MQRRSLEVIAAILLTLMVIVATAGLDNLPRQLRDSVTAAGSHLTGDRALFDQNRSFIESAIRDEPVLFQTKAATWHERLDQDQSRLDASAAALVPLQQLAKANRRTDSDKVEKSLHDFDLLRKGAIDDESEIRSKAERWLKDKRELPKRLDAMRADYESAQSFDIGQATAPVRKAMADWPAKRNDLQSRLDSLAKVQADGEQIWQASVPLRDAAAANKLAGTDYAALFSDEDRLAADARQLKDGAAAADALSAQLYTSWDKLLVDLDDDNGYREKVRVVRTTFQDAALAGGQTTTNEKWETVDSARFRDARRSVGMTIEHKPAGVYDFESEHVVAPPAYAYVAPPGQANAYGAWTSGVWHWLPQYLILSHLLHASRGPLTTGDFEAYQSARRRGEIFYGRSDEFRPRWYSHRESGSVLSRAPPAASAPRSPATGWYTERPKPSWGDRVFGGSKYQSRGAFSGSRYQSRGTFGGMRSYSRGGGFGGFRGGRR